MSTISEALFRIESWIKSNHPEPNGIEFLRSGLTHAEIDDHVGPLNLPQEFYDLYQWKGGSYHPVGFPLFFGADFLNLGSPYVDLLEFANEHDLICLFSLGEYSLVLDLNRWRQGVSNVLPVAYLYANSEEIEVEEVAFRSLTDMMLTLAECLEQGACWLDEDNILTGNSDQIKNIHRKYNPGCEDGFLEWIQVWLEDEDDQENPAWATAHDALVSDQDSNLIQAAIQAGRDEKELALPQANLSQIPLEIMGLSTYLRGLYLFENQIIFVPHEINQLKGLRILSLHDNEIDRLPSEIGDLQNLSELVLYNNQLIDIPKEIGRLSKLSELYLGNNQLTSLPIEIGCLSNLKILTLNQNKLSSLPEEIGQLINLKELSIADNNLTEIPLSIGRLKRLETLNISGNQLESIPPQIGELKTLEELNLANNRITQLPSEIGGLKKLRILSLRNNQLASLPREIGSMRNLTQLSFSGNPLPDDLIGKSTQFVKSYLLKQS
ncbi:MAG: leucine-rich repeat domain-containing protein [Synechococcaceae cyanobacterium SM2_3_1]|nr:leucine-rich repeat domain-containing protein [Synechococcaceae cyanobacterium SM2_3_1]